MASTELFIPVLKNLRWWTLLWCGTYCWGRDSRCTYTWSLQIFRPDWECSCTARCGSWPSCRKTSTRCRTSGPSFCCCLKRNFKFFIGTMSFLITFIVGIWVKKWIKTPFKCHWKNINFECSSKRVQNLKICKDVYFNAVCAKAQPSRSNTDYLFNVFITNFNGRHFHYKINFQIKFDTFLIKQKTFLILMKVYLGSTKHFD